MSFLPVDDQRFAMVLLPGYAMIVVMRSIQVHAASNQSLPEMAIDSLEWSKFTKCPILKTQNWGPIQRKTELQFLLFFGAPNLSPKALSPCHPFFGLQTHRVFASGRQPWGCRFTSWEDNWVGQTCCMKSVFFLCFCWGLKKKATRFLREIYNEIYMQVSSNICCDSLQRGPVLCPISIRFRWNKWKNQKETNLWKIGSS